MRQEFRNIIKADLVSAVKVKTRTDGGYASLSSSDTAPETPEVFRKRLEGQMVSAKPNNWDLDALEELDLIDLAMKGYVAAYADWVRLPLSGDAPPQIVAWQKEARGE